MGTNHHVNHVVRLDRLPDVVSHLERHDAVTYLDDLAAMFGDRTGHLPPALTATHDRLAALLHEPIPA